MNAHQRCFAKAAASIAAGLLFTGAASAGVALPPAASGNYLFSGN